MSRKDAILVVGGGIGGLYTAYRLLEHGETNITVIEKGWRWGGRVHTLEREGGDSEDKIYYECGAGRFSDEHKILIGLIRRFGLEDRMVRLPSESETLYRHFTDLTGGQFMTTTTSTLLPLYNKLAKIPIHDDYRSKTFLELCYELFGVERTSLLRGHFGYDDEFYDKNAYDALKTFQGDFRHNSVYYVLNGGLALLTDALVSYLKEHGVHLLLKTKLVDVEKGRRVTLGEMSSGKIIHRRATYDRVVLCLDRWALVDLPFLEPLRGVLESVEITPLTRIYAQFPLGKGGEAWFSGIPKTSTNLPIRMFIPINASNGLCMISYSDRDTARYWQDLYLSSSKSQFTKTLMGHIRHMFPEHTIPEPLWVDKLHWVHGVHVWKPNADSDRVMDSLISGSYPALQGIHVCGEAYSHRQGWIEGALETADMVVQWMRKRHGAIRTYTLAEIARSVHPTSSVKLIVVGGNVYDIKDWIPKHPGGKVILSAVGLPDATQLFHFINHPQYAYTILEKYFVGVVAVAKTT